MIKNLSSLFVSQTCYGCEGSLTSQEDFICFSCLSNLQETNFHLSPTENELYYRLAGKVPIQGASSLFYFDKQGTLQSLMQHLKYKDAPHLGTFLGESLARALKGSLFLDEVEAVIPVPLHWKKKMKRGYNQTEYIAKGFQRISQIPLRGKLLKRIQHTQTQTQLSNSSRWDNVSKAFEVKKACPPSILLLDDVITTGATLESCIKALLKSPVPPQEIRVASIGMARNS